MNNSLLVPNNSLLVCEIDYKFSNVSTKFSFDNPNAISHTVTKGWTQKTSKISLTPIVVKLGCELFYYIV